MLVFGFVEIQRTQLFFSTYLYLSVFAMYMTFGMTPVLWFVVGLGAYVMVRQMKIGGDAFKSLRRVAIDGPLAVFGIWHRFRLLFAFLTIMSASILALVPVSPLSLASKLVSVGILILLNAALMQTLLTCLVFGVWAGLRLRSGILGFLIVFGGLVFAYHAGFLALASIAFVSQVSAPVAFLLFFLQLLIPQNVITLGLILNLRGRVYTTTL